QGDQGAVGITGGPREHFLGILVFVDGARLGQIPAESRVAVGEPGFGRCFRWTVVVGNERPEMTLRILPQLGGESRLAGAKSGLIRDIGRGPVGVLENFLEAPDGFPILSSL